MRIQEITENYDWYAEHPEEDDRVSEFNDTHIGDKVWVEYGPATSQQFIGTVKNFFNDGRAIVRADPRDGKKGSQVTVGAGRWKKLSTPQAVFKAKLGSTPKVDTPSSPNKLTFPKRRQK